MNEFLTALREHYIRTVTCHYIVPLDIKSKLIKEALKEVLRSNEAYVNDSRVLYTSPTAFAQWFAGEYGLKERKYDFELVEQVLLKGTNKYLPLFEEYDFIDVAQEDLKTIKQMKEAGEYYDENKE